MLIVQCQDADHHDLQSAYALKQITCEERHMLGTEIMCLMVYWCGLFMAKVSRVRHLKYRCRNDKGKRLRLPSCSHKIFKDIKKPCKLSEKKDWEDATCSVCMESPHNAVLLLCSSYNKGCRPYMCATGYRFSNCLDQYKKAYSKATPGTNSPNSLSSGWPEGRSEVSELLCPLCRGQVKGWTLVEPARKFLNKKKRSCMQENCSFVGTYKQLKKHVKTEHPWARPREVDPSLDEKWKSLEREREISDVMSTFSPGTIVLGDYVIDPNLPFIRDMDLDDLLGDDLEAFGANRFRSGGFQLHRASARSYDSFEDDDDDDDVSIQRHSAFGRDDMIPLSRHHRRMLFLGRSRRRRRRD